jgi:hypothetical protein
MADAQDDSPSNTGAESEAEKSNPDNTKHATKADDAKHAGKTDSEVVENGADAALDGEASGKDGAEKPPAAAPGKKRPLKRDREFWFWLAGILVVLSIEVFIYGHNGKIEVCVGKEGLTDWSLKDHARTPENFRRAPTCAHRMNLGMYEGTEEQSQAALRDACARATVTNRLAMPDCLRRDKQWERKVEKTQIAPWDERLYRRMLWLD